MPTEPQGSGTKAVGSGMEMGMKTGINVNRKLDEVDLPQRLERLNTTASGGLGLEIEISHGFAFQFPVARRMHYSGFSAAIFGCLRMLRVAIRS